MTFVTVNELKKRFPEHQIYLLSEMDKNRTEEEKKRYKFEFTGWYPIKFARAQKNLLLRLACIARNYDEFAECENLYRNCDLMVDISGYGLGTNWGIANCKKYLDHIEFAKMFDIPLYILPQSFGPFSFCDTKWEETQCRIASLLPYAKVIYAREKAGFDALTDAFHLTNVELGDDIVLCAKDFDINSVVDTVSDHDIPVISPGSVALIPNQRLLTNIGREPIYSLYKSIISLLLKKHKKVYLMTHASSDREICLCIKKMFDNEEKVEFLDCDYECYEMNELIKQFDYLVASRYHSIIHALKNKVPCLALGWSEKYDVLMQRFDLNQYSVNLKSGFTEESILQMLESLEDYYSVISSKIENRLKDMQMKDVFSTINIR